jgi:hypothetical protein
VGEIVIDHPVPHVLIRERDDRTLKTSWSNREVPLVGAALEAAKQVVTLHLFCRTLSGPLRARTG